MKNEPMLWPLHLSREDIRKAKRLFLKRKIIMARLEQMDSAFLKELIPQTLPAASHLFKRG